MGPEQLLAVNLVIGDCLLAFVRNDHRLRCEQEAPGSERARARQEKVDEKRTEGKFQVIIRVG